MSIEVQRAVPAVAASHRLLAELLQGYGPRDFTVRFWDDSVAEPDPGQSSRFSLILEHPGALRQMFWPFDKLALGESYIYGDFEIEGDFHAFMGVLRFLINRKLDLRTKLRLLKMMLALPNERRPRAGRQGVKLSGQVHSRERDRQAISYHYDLPAAFYALWLDKLQQYTCGYYRSDADDCDAAHEQKIDFICRKLRLKPGERVLDIGCGWGGFLEFAGRKYGIEGVGLTISTEQAEWARNRLRVAGLQDCCRIEICDYRDFKDSRGFDKAVSVGLCEHLGLKKLPEFFNCVWRLLKPGGAYLNQHITMHALMPIPKWRGFVRKYVFPDGELQPISDSLRASEKAGFEIRDVECLREHYIRTLEHWLANLEAKRAEVAALTDDVTFRIYRLYLAGAAAGFRTGLYGLCQTLQVKPDNGRSGVPMLREDWYH